MTHIPTGLRRRVLPEDGPLRHVHVAAPLPAPASRLLQDQRRHVLHHVRDRRHLRLRLHRPPPQQVLRQQGIK